MIEKRIRTQPVVRREALAQIEAQLAQRLAKEGLPYRLVSRVKSPWSIYSKMRAEHKTLRPGDGRVRLPHRRAHACRECYHALGVVHSAFKPLDARFRDFIAIPKANGYQSLHTVLFGPYGSPIEVQIRTEEMDLIAERGIAAHWSYKHGGDGAEQRAEPRARSGSRSLVESQRATGSSLEFLENVKVDLFPDEVYLFTPKGDILVAAAQRHRARLRLRGAHRRRQPCRRRARGQASWCRCARKLASGQTRGDHHRASRRRRSRSGWSSWSPARRAPRSAISSSTSNTRTRCSSATACSIARWKRCDTSLDRVPQQRLDAYLAEHRYPRLEALLADIALGNRMPSQVAQALARDGAADNAAADAAGRARLRPSKILITGAERGVISFANCCLPIPGDEIMGYHTAGKGIVVHRLECPNVAELPQVARTLGADRLGPRSHRRLPAPRCRSKSTTGPGVLAQVAAAIAQAESNIDRVEYLERDSNIARSASRSKCTTASTWPT